MKFDLTTLFSSDMVQKPSNAPGGFVTKSQKYNKRTGGYVTQLGTNNGHSVTRIDGQSGCVLGKVCYIDMSRSPAEIKLQIIDAYRNGFTQQEIANATGYSQSRISQIINGK